MTTPFLEITIPVPTGLNPALRPPVATYEWQTLSGSPDPVEARCIFISTLGFNDNFTETENYIRNNPDSPEWASWQPYNPPNIGTTWTSPPIDFGRYVFAVQGRDSNGTACEDFSPDRNMRRILISVRSTGPLLTVTGDHIDPIITAVTTTPVTEIELLGGTPVSFCWTADASSYGGVVAGYRYGWDLTNPEDDSQWDIPFTPFINPEECSPVRIYDTGIHVFYIEVIDNDGYKSQASIEITYTPNTPVEQTSWGSLKVLYTE